MKCRALATLIAVMATAACQAAIAGRPVHPGTSSRSKAVASTHPSAARGASKPSVHVHASLFEADGRTYGVGMPIIVRFDKKVTDVAAFVKAATVTVNGKPANGAWYWELDKLALSGFAMEAHYRQPSYWPAQSHIDVNLPIKGLSAGTGRAFDDNLTLSIDIGADHETTVFQSGKPHMVVRSGGVVVNTLPVSLGSADFPTYSGVKIVEEFDPVQNMEGTPVPWSVRITNSGEFVHAASWNGLIGTANTSHGCTNLRVADAKWFYHFSQLGDVITYPDAPGGRMQVWDGIGDWNVPWPVWRLGGVH